MAIPIEMPKLSDTMTEGTLVTWHKNVGDTVEIGDILAEIETDKATMEMEAFDEGILAAISVQAGEKAAIGAQLGLLAEEGEDVDASASSESAAPAAPTAQDEPVASSSPAAVTPSGSVLTGDTARIKVSPLARKIAESKGLDLKALTGSGPGGRIVKADVESASVAPASSPDASAAAGLAAAAKQRMTSAPPSTPVAPSASPPAPAPAAISPIASGEDKIIPLTGMRKIIAERLLTSKQTIPHFYLHVDVDVEPMLALRKQVNAQAETTHGNKYTVNDFIVKALINASVAVPEVNASFNGDSIVQFANVGVSVAIAVEDGLVTPVVKNAETKSLLQISREIKDMAVRARDKKLKPNEFDGGTVTISNLGSYGIKGFDAIVNPPQAAILSVGAASQQAVVRNGEIVPGMIMDLGLSCDHRVVDGAVAARFLGEVKKLIENPALMLI